MPNPYVQVALTYPRRLFSSWIGSLMFIIFVVLYGISLGSLSDIGRVQGFLVGHLMYLLFLYLYFTSQIKEQFADARSRLTPGFRQAHLTVAAVVIVMITIILPLTISFIMGLRPLGLPSVYVMIFAAILWSILLDTRYSGIIFVTGWIFLITDVGQRCLRVVIVEYSELQTTGLLVLGILLVSLGIVRLVHLHEEMPGYQTQTGWNWMVGNTRLPPRWSGGNRFFPRLGDWIADRQMGILTRHARRATVSWRSRICRWQAGMIFGWSLLFWNLGAAAYLYILSRWAIPNQPDHTGMASGMFGFFLVVFIPIIAVGAIFRQIPFLGRGLLLPIDRKSYLQQYGAASVWSILKLWGSISVIMILVNCLLSDPLSLPAPLILFSASVQVVAFGMFAWTARYGSMRLNILVLMLFITVVQFLSMLWFIMPGSLHREPPCNILWIAAGFTLLGLLISYDAYRRWLKADMP